jgi:sulfate adenylyltransferase subunit 1 (EFTu-like GTPase family)
MDLIDWSHARFEALEEEANKLANEVGVDDVTVIPVAARSGDNVVTRSECLDWYRGRRCWNIWSGSKPASEPRAAMGQQAQQ